MRSRALLLGCLLSSSCDLWPQFQNDRPAQPRSDAATPACAPRQVGLSDRGITYDNGAKRPTCSFDQNGAAILQYGALAACTKPEPYWGCLVASHQDVRAFVAGQGIFDVQFCVEGGLDGAINLWIQDPRTKCRSEGRLNLPLVPRDEQFASSCRRRWFSASDISFPDRCVARQGPDITECAGSAADSGADANVGALSLADASQDGFDGGDAGSGCDLSRMPDFGDSELALISELCVPAKQLAAGQQVKIVLTSVVYYPAACVCADDGACGTRGPCTRDFWPDLACCWCGDDCGGMCSSDLASAR
jgi:hypothetical protein